MAMTKITFEDLPSTNSPIDANNLNTLQNNVETAINSGDSGTITEVENWVKDKTGLGATTKILDSVNINNIDNSTFAYLLSCNYGGTSIGNGYLLNIVYTSTYKMQVYFSATAGGFQYRRYVNGTWTAWTTVEESHSSLSTFSNSWEINGQCSASVNGYGLKTLNLSCRNGTSTTIMTLPQEYRPTSTVILPATNFTNAGYVIITTNGVITVSSNIFISGSGNVVCNGSYL